MMKAADKDGNHTIDYEEFEKVEISNLLCRGLTHLCMEAYDSLPWKRAHGLSMLMEADFDSPAHAEFVVCVTFHP